MPIRRFIMAAFVCAGTAAVQNAGDEKALFADLPTVEAGSLHARTLAEAPAHFTVIAAAEIPVMPLVGLSPAFVRAGAAVRVFPDYADLGWQSAEMALRLLRRDEHGLGIESPGKVPVAVSQRVPACRVWTSFRKCCRRRCIDDTQPAA